MKKAILLFSLISFQILFSQNVFKDDFSTYGTGIPLSGQGLWTNVSGLTSIGLGGCSGVGCLPANVVPKSMTYSNYGTTTKVLKVDGIKDGVAHPITPAIADGDFYVSYVLNLTSAPLSEFPNDYFRVLSGAQTNVTYRMVVKNAGFGYNIGIRKGANSNTTVYSSALYNFDEDVLIVLKYSHMPLANDDMIFMYVNPIFANGEPATFDAFTSSGFDQSGGVDRLGFRLNQNILMPSGFAGLVSVSSTWSGLSFLPLSTSLFDKSTFLIDSTSASNGILNIKSNVGFNKGSISIFDLQGRLIENKQISLSETSNQVAINPIISKGIFIVKIESQNQEFTQKITVN